MTPDGVVPLPQERPASAQLALMQRVKDVERLVVQATTGPADGTRRRGAALAAFARHPLVDSDVLAAELLAGYEAAFPELLQLWRNDSDSNGDGT